MTLTALEFYPQPVIDACNSCPGDWRGSVDALIQTLTSTNRCYSSGELARILRICAPSLRFAVPGIGEYTRDAFYGDNLPEYDDGQGNPVAPVQIGRMTQGLFPSRTGAGQMVFVYGPCQAACDVAEYEVYIPRPGRLPPVRRPQRVRGPCVPAGPADAGRRPGVRPGGR